MQFNLISIIPTTISMTLLTKIGVLSILGLFTIFLIVVVRQIQSLNIIVTENIYGGLLQFISILLLITSILLFVAAWMLL